MTGLELAANGQHADEVVEIDLVDLLESLEFEETAVPTDAEAAAVASAISTHLTDRARAATAAAAADADTTETVNQWTFSGRLERTRGTPSRRPRQVERGTEWRTAARSL